MDRPASAIRLELWLDGDAPIGRAIGRDEERQFAGWLGLVSAVEALMTDGREPPPVADSPAEPQHPTDAE